MTLPKPWLLALGGFVLVAGFVLGGVLAVLIQLAGGAVVGLGHVWSQGWRPSELRRPCSCLEIGDVDEAEPLPCPVHAR